MPHKPKILYFEDDTFIAKMYETKLELDGFDVKYFEYPPDNLIDLVLAEKPDLIFMDVIMPNMDGFAATTLLQADDRTKNIPIFGMSNLGQRNDIQRALSLGMWDYWVSAQHMPGEVVEKIRSILNGEPRQPRPPKPDVEPRSHSENLESTARSYFGIRGWLWAVLLVFIGVLVLAVAIFGT